MAHGTPDWGVTAGAVTTYQLTDLGELAARLGSIVTFDRRGDVIWFDDFEDGIAKWSEYAGATDSIALIARSASRSKGYSARLDAGTDFDNLVGLRHYLTYPVLSNLGFEISFAHHPNIVQVLVQLRVFDGTNLTTTSVRWVNEDNEVQVNDAVAGWTTVLENLDLHGHPLLFHTAKLIVDPATPSYVRFIIDSVSIDLSAYTPPVAANATAPQMDIYIEFTGDGSVVRSSYADDAIVTVNEPV